MGGLAVRRAHSNRPLGITGVIDRHSQCELRGRVEPYRQRPVTRISRRHDHDDTGTH
jgi:hypothetical protein